MIGTSRSKGQALVELALGLPLVLLLIFGVLELGRAFFTKIALTNAAREGANYFVYNRADDTVIPDTKSRVMNEIWSVSQITITPAEIDILCLDVEVNLVTKEIISENPDPDCLEGSTVDVTVSNIHYINIFGFPVESYPMQSNARMVLP